MLSQDPYRSSRESFTLQSGHGPIVPSGEQLEGHMYVDTNAEVKVNAPIQRG